MTTSEFKKVYWKYYLNIEKDVQVVETYVSFHPDNYNCFSVEFIKLYQVICSEIDVICDKYCKYIKGTTTITGKYYGIRDYAKYILTKHPEIVSAKVHLIEQNDCKLIPWEQWRFDPVDHRNGAANVTPAWWRKYNYIKHRRSDYDNSIGKYNYQHASLYNVLNALAALYVIEKYFYIDLANDEAAPLAKVPITKLTPASNLFCLFDSNEIILSLYKY